MNYHVPVLAHQCIDLLNIKPDGVYVDVTFGGGGHSKLILEKLGPDGLLVAFDQDADAKANLPEDDRVKFAPANFRHLKRYLRLFGITQIDGLLADLGVSSHQFDVADRGFSFRFDADLDMRMNQHGGQTAAELLAKSSTDELQQLFSQYGEVRNAKTLANHLMGSGQLRKIKTIRDFVELMEPMIRGNRSKYLAQVFQALRIAVNEEMESLEEMLEQTIELLKPEGRLVVLSYHSLEDRMIKNVLKTGQTSGQQIKDFYGNIYRPFKILTKKPLEANAAEVAENSRARSAKLRAGEKLDLVQK